MVGALEQRHAAQVAVKRLVQAAETAQAVPEHAQCLRVPLTVPGCFHARDGLPRVLLGAGVVTQAQAGPGDVEGGPGLLTGVAGLSGDRTCLGRGFDRVLVPAHAYRVRPGEVVEMDRLETPVAEGIRGRAGQRVHLVPVAPVSPLLGEPVHGLGHVDDPRVVTGGGNGLQRGEPVLALSPQPGHRRLGGRQVDQPAPARRRRPVLQVEPAAGDDRDLEQPVEHPAPRRLPIRGRLLVAEPPSGEQPDEVVEPVAVLVRRLQQPELDEFLQEVFGVGDAGLGQDRGQVHAAVGARNQGHPPE